MKSNNNESPKNDPNFSHSQNSVIKFEEYYENVDEDHHNQVNENKENIDEPNDIDLEREEMENDYELVKSLNNLKERNKKLDSINKYQKIKIESLEGELEKAIAQLKIKDAEIEDLKNSTNNQGKSAQNKAATYVAQINNLNLQIDKYKALLNDKKNEYNTLLEKYNEIHKKYDQNIVQEKKVKQELITKDKQIAKLIEEKTGLETKSVVIGHLQRGGSPSMADRVFASRIGVEAVNLIDQGKGGLAVGSRNGKIISEDIEKAVKTVNTFDKQT